MSDRKCPLFERQRSLSCSSCETLERETINVEIKFTRRRSLGCNVKFGIETPVATIHEFDKNNSETIINIPALIKANNSKIHSVSVTKNTRNGSIVSCGTIKREKSLIQNPWIALRELIIPFIVAGLGNVSAGIVLQKVQHWPAFEAVPQLIILITALIGINGNVESTLASRLSTHANCGHLDNFTDLKTLIAGNMSLIQCQASVVGLIAGLVAVVLSYISGANNEGTTFTTVVFVSASSVVAINLATLILGTVMCTVIILARKFGINPDNIATPIAASMGDGITLVLLAYVSNFLYKYRTEFLWLSPGLLILLMSLAPLWGFLARKNRFTHTVVYTGWFPFIGGMLIDNTGGMVMERALNRFAKLAEFQPIMNGLGGNIASIQSSRLSTWLHQTVPPGQLPKSDPSSCIWPQKTFFGKSRHSKMTRILLVIAAPCHFLYLIILRFAMNDFTITLPFSIAYIISGVIQVALLLQITYMLVLWLWSKKINPDNAALPFLTALGDLFGSVLFAVAFIILHELNDPNAVLKDDSDNITTQFANFTTQVY